MPGMFIHNVYLDMVRLTNIYGLATDCDARRPNWWLRLHRTLIHPWQFIKMKGGAWSLLRKQITLRTANRIVLVVERSF